MAQYIICPGIRSLIEGCNRGLPLLPKVAEKYLNRAHFLMKLKFSNLSLDLYKIGQLFSRLLIADRCRRYAAKDVFEAPTQ